MKLYRIFAWVLLVGFLLLIINILFIGWHRETSAYVYLIVAVLYFLYTLYGKKNEGSNKNRNSNTDVDDENTLK